MVNQKLSSWLIESICGLVNMCIGMKAGQEDYLIMKKLAISWVLIIHVYVISFLKFAYLLSIIQILLY